MAPFETACATRGPRLYVLPPECPQINGAVEALNPILDSFQHPYNHHRPHGALAGLTPAAHLAKRRAEQTPPSHMC